MKKIDFTPRAKKVSVITGAAVLCLGVLSAVLFQNNASSQIKTALASSVSFTAASGSSGVSPSPILTVGDTPSTPSGSGTGSAFDPAKEESRSEPLTVVSKPTSQPPKPVVEGDSKDGKQPTNSALTDRTKKPTYTSKPTVTSKPSSSTKTSSKSSGGSASNGSHAGEFYDPVFGWTKSTGGEMTTVSGDWGGGEQIGSMD